MNVRELMKAWDNAVADAHTHIAHDEEIDFEHVSGMAIQSDIRAGRGDSTGIICPPSFFNCTNRKVTCTWANCN